MPRRSMPSACRWWPTSLQRCLRPQACWPLMETGDRKDGCATAHVARQYLESVGKTNNDIVAVTTLWADEAHDSWLHAAPFAPVVRLHATR